MILDVEPKVDCGHFPVKRVTGELVDVRCIIVADGHELLAAEVYYGPLDAKGKIQDPQHLHLKAIGNDRYSASFVVGEMGTWGFIVRSWLDHFGSWQQVFRRRVDTGSEDAELRSELLEGAGYLGACQRRAKGEDKKLIKRYIQRFESGDVEAALEDTIVDLARTYDPQEAAAESPVYEVLVERPLAQFSSWYEFFPRSLGEGQNHGTLDDAARHLDYVKEMGFDIAYLTPIHPIGKSFRKGKDNAPTAAEGEPGSPYAIGSEDGGLTDVHPELGGMAAFERFMARAKEIGLEVALDIAFNCSPDHPWVKAHPDWFNQRPDGSIRYAENPPKKYQDIYPVNFSSKDWKGLWQALYDVLAFWCDKGVRVFRVDNPHTKALPFWGWCIASLREKYPDILLLSEAFTRPEQMYALAKLGFSQSYTYFTWRYDKQDFSEYLTELFHTKVAEFLRPNFWPNTHDILPPYLRSKATFQARLVMAATMAGSYGIYGPAFELMDNEPHDLREENKNNEKYEIKEWNYDDPNSLKPLITQINQIRAQNPALRTTRSLKLHTINNDKLLAYSKQDGDNRVLVIVSFDEHYTQSGFTELDLESLGLEPNKPFIAEDLLTGERYTWQGAYNYVELNPHHFPAHIFRLTPRPSEDAARQRAL